MELTEEHEWDERRIRWRRLGEGAPVVFCHGTPWSSRLWAPFAEALSSQYTTYGWDMPGYGTSRPGPDGRVSLDVQGQVLRELLRHWDLDMPM